MTHPRVRALRYLVSLILTVGCLLLSDPLAALAHGKWDKPDKMKKVPVAQPILPSRPLPNVAFPKGRAAASTRSAEAACADPTIDLKLLVLSADGNETGLPAIEQALKYVGTPYTVWKASQRPGQLTADQLASGCHSLYQGVILATGALSYSPDGGTTWQSALSAAEWQTLWSYEATFGLRQLAWYTFPGPDWGYNWGTGVSTSTPLDATFTALGKSLFPYVNTANPLPIKDAWAYLATPLDASTQPVLVDGHGNALIGIHTHADGRQSMVVTFDSNQYLTHALVLSHGLISWVTKGMFLGQRHTLLSAQVDDLFIDSDMWTAQTPCGTAPDATGQSYRVNGADWQDVVAWQRAVRRGSLLGAFRLAIAFNGWGTTRVYDPDSLTPAVQQTQSEFNWINHTYDHEDLDALTYQQGRGEIENNIRIAQRLKLQNFSKTNLVTPGISGLNNADVMRAALDAGVRYLVSDTSLKGYDNPTPNAGIYNPLQPAILEIPRHPTNLFYNVGTPDGWLAEYNCIYRSFWGKDLSYSELLDVEASNMLRYLMLGDFDPVMFHQENLRSYDGTHSLLGDLLDRVFDKYSRLYTMPIVSPTMDFLGWGMAERMKYDAAGVTASIVPGRSITLSAAKDALVPVTGLSKYKLETYGGQDIAYLPLQGGKSVTLSLK